MIYKILNKITESKVKRLRPIAIKFLNGGLNGPGAEASAERLEVDRKYLLLIKHFVDNSKRKYMINRNYLNFLKAVIYLYTTSSVSIQGGVLMAPAEVYSTINSVKKSFDDAAAILGIK